MTRVAVCILLCCALCRRTAADAALRRAVVILSVASEPQRLVHQAETRFDHHTVAQALIFVRVISPSAVSIFAAGCELVEPGPVERMEAKKAYLVAYNALQALGWAAVLGLTMGSIARSGHEGSVYEAAGMLVCEKRRHLTSFPPLCLPRLS